MLKLLIQERIKKRSTVSNTDMTPNVGTITAHSNLEDERYVWGGYHELPYNDAMVYAYYTAIAGRPTNLFMRITIDNLYMPILDFDSNNTLNHTETFFNYLSEKCPHPYAIIQSSGIEDDRFDKGNNYWVVLDKLGTIDDCLKVMNDVNILTSQRSDYRYIDCATNSKDLALRAYPKGIFIPKIIFESNEPKSKQFNDWINTFKTYWDSEGISDIIAYKFSVAI